jgi:hypothetical protein
MAAKAKKTDVAEAVEKEVKALSAPKPEVKVVAVVPALMQEVLSLLQTELPMKTVRVVVAQLEQCPLMTVNQPEE